MEIRYTVPYVSALHWVLNDPINEAIPVKDQNGNQQSVVVKRDPGITFEVTPYLGNIPTKTISYEFKKFPEDTNNGMDDILQAAGVDVAQIWADSLDQMAEVFPILAEPEVDAKKFGPAYFLRLDSWKANLDLATNKSVVAIIGVYDSTDFSNVTAYISLLFADGNTLRQREQELAQLQEQVNLADSILANPPTFPNWNQLTVEEKNQRIDQAPLAKKYATERINQINSQLVAPLSNLLGIPAVQQSIGALLVGLFATLKATDPEWAEVDVASIMSKFALPDIS